MIQALFFDIDGTLVSYKTHTIPTSTLHALTEAKTRGVRIFIATGRPRILINNITALQEQNLIDGYITMDGSYCFAGEQVIYKKAMLAEDVQNIMQYCEDKRIACAVSTGDEVCVCQPDDEIRHLFHDLLNVRILPVKTPQEAIAGKEVFQMNPVITAGQEPELSARVKHCEISRWYPTLADITAKGNTKQRGIEEIIRHFGISREETMAFGDADNDIEMLRYAAIGVAVGNATPHIRSAAKYVTTEVEHDGIANALRHFDVI